VRNRLTPVISSGPAPTGAARMPALLVTAALVLTTAACRQDMHDAPRYDPLEASPVFSGGASSQPLVEGTDARGHLNDDELLETGRLNGQVVDQFPFEITSADLDRGQVRFNVYCSPCHGQTGQGDGLVVQRGYKAPPSLHDIRLRVTPAGYYFGVISEGFGVMPDYRAQIAPDDRWRIIAYIRALQLSHEATVADVPAADLERLENPAAPAAGATEDHQ
jgi:mono/diheme cytochrome c family protein